MMLGERDEPRHLEESVESIRDRKGVATMDHVLRRSKNGESLLTDEKEIGYDGAVGVAKARYPRGKTVASMSIAAEGHVNMDSASVRANLLTENRPKPVHQRRHEKKPQGRS
jgi:hypothetical protein